MRRSLLYIGVFATAIGCTGPAAVKSSNTPIERLVEDTGSAAESDLPPSTDPPNRGDTGTADPSNDPSDSNTEPDAEESDDGMEAGGISDTGSTSADTSDTGGVFAEDESDASDEADTGIYEDEPDAAPTPPDDSPISEPIESESDSEESIVDVGTEDTGSASAEAEGDESPSGGPDADTGLSTGDSDAEEPSEDGSEPTSLPSESEPSPDAEESDDAEPETGDAETPTEPSVPPEIEPEPGDACGDGWILDCGMVCTLDLFVGDGTCDDASRPFGDWFACPHLGWDGGDCPVGEWPPPESPGETGDDCGDGMVLDCGLECSATLWLGDGWCDDETSPYGIHFDCDFFEADAGDCTAE